jgi:DNA-binding transcriptional regulator LsrR (DeoR family)
MRDEKLKRLEAVARLYYEQGLNQADIARAEGVSRPLVSRLLAEAREAGIVEIRIHSLASESAALDQVRRSFGLRGGRLTADGAEDLATNQWLAEAALDLIDDVGGGHLGLGWGQAIGVMVSVLEARPPTRRKITDVAPLVGNRGVPIRYYHSNENTRIVSQQTRSQGHYLHTPAIVETRRELNLLQQTGHYQAILAEWEQLDVALVNIGNHPSTPDFASVARYGNRLAEHRTVGRLIAYFFNRDGQIIESDEDYAIQIPLALLRRCPNVIGLCSANVGPDALLGALRTGALTHVVAREALVATALERASTD